MRSILSFAADFSRLRKILGALLMALFVLTTACGRGAAPTHLTLSGHVEATDVRVATRYGGVLERFAVAEGDRLEEGVEAARFDTVDLELAVDGARAEKELATARLALLEAGYEPEDIAVARGEVERIEVESAAAERDLERFAGLLEAGSGAEKPRDDARARRDGLARSLEMARHRLRKLEGGFRREEIAAARAQVAAADARIAQLEEQIHDAVVLCPASGVVTEKLVEQGEILPPGSTLLVLTDLSSARLVAWIGNGDLGRLRIGDEVEVRTDDGVRRAGQVSWISPRAEFTPKNVQTREAREQLVYKVKIALDNHDEHYKPGMPADAVLELDGGGEAGTDAEADHAS